MLDSPLYRLVTSPVLLVERLLRMAFALCEVTLEQWDGASGAGASDLEFLSPESQSMWVSFMDGVALLQVRLSRFATTFKYAPNELCNI